MIRVFLHVGSEQFVKQMHRHTMLGNWRMERCLIAATIVGSPLLFVSVLVRYVANCTSMSHTNVFIIFSKCCA